MQESLRVLALEPFYGGSHRSFLDGWAQNSRHRWTILGLPDHCWKWRMRHAAWTFAQEVRERASTGEAWDVIFASDMLPLAEFQGLAPSSTAELPAVVYFHENQLTYPVRCESERDLHFAMTNLITACAADSVWFNSYFHRDDLLAAAERFLRRMPDHPSLEMVDAIRAKASVQPPGIESFPSTCEPESGALHIVWAARWEHDKNPEDFFAALDQLVARGLDFRVSVLGQSFRDVPPVFAEYRHKLSDRIEQWGFLESRDAYVAALQAADVFVSTANHEFFGIAAVEAMAAGCFPLLPRRLSYPELVTDDQGVMSEDFLYDGTVAGLVERLAELSQRNQERALPHGAAAGLADRFRWPIRAAAMDAALVQVAADCQK